MTLKQRLLLRTFGRPHGFLGRLGGVVMARANRNCGAWTADLLQIQSNDRVLEVGFGPGVLVERLVHLTPHGHVAGADVSPEMVRQARRRNAAAVRAGHVDLRQAAVDMLPFDDGAFDKVVSINTMQVWPDIPAGLRELRRVAKSQGRIALAFTPYSGQSADGLVETVAAAGFADARLVENDENICVVAVKA